MRAIERHESKRESVSGRSSSVMFGQSSTNVGRTRGNGIISEDIVLSPLNMDKKKKDPYENDQERLIHKSVPVRNEDEIVVETGDNMDAVSLN